MAIGVVINEVSPNKTSAERLNGGISGCRVGGSSTRSPGSSSSSGSVSGNENIALGSDGSCSGEKLKTATVNENIKLINCADNCNANDLQLNNGSSSSISGGELISRQVPLNLSPDKVDRNRNDDVVIERSISTNEIGKFSNL